MIGFPEGQVSVLKEVRSVWSADRFIVVGAAAIACHIGMRWRGTIDLDLSVAVTPESFARDLESLGWRRDSTSHHRWIAQNGSIVDVMPAHPSLVSEGGFTWPDAGARMNLVGFRFAFADAMPFEIVPGVVVRVASLRSLVVHKMGAYLDQPWERDTDLSDIAHILFEFLGPDAEARWSDEVLDLGLDFDDVSPFVLGKQLGAMVDKAERRLVQSFVTAVENPADPLSTVHRMAQRAPTPWRDPNRLRRSLIAFRRGFESSFPGFTP